MYREEDKICYFVEELGKAQPASIYVKKFALRAVIVERRDVSKTEFESWLYFCIPLAIRIEPTKRFTPR